MGSANNCVEGQFWLSKKARTTHYKESHPAHVKYLAEHPDKACFMATVRKPVDEKALFKYCMLMKDALSGQWTCGVQAPQTSRSPEHEPQNKNSSQDARAVVAGADEIRTLAQSRAAGAETSATTAGGDNIVTPTQAGVAMAAAADKIVTATQAAGADEIMTPTQTRDNGPCATRGEPSDSGNESDGDCLTGVLTTIAQGLVDAERAERHAEDTKNLAERDFIAARSRLQEQDQHLSVLSLEVQQEQRTVEELEQQLGLRKRKLSEMQNKELSERSELRQRNSTVASVQANVTEATQQLAKAKRRSCKWKELSSTAQKVSP